MRGANFSRSFFLPLLGRLLTPAVFVAFAFAQTDCKAGDAQAEIDFSKATFTPVEPLLSRDDKPVFVRELYSLRRDEDFRIARFLGFNAAIGHGAAFLELAETADFHVTEASWWGGGTSAETVLNEAATCDGRSQLISMNLHDEPDLRMHYASPEHLRPHAMTLKARHPELRVSATLAGSGRALESWPAYAEFLDVMRVDPYPLVSGKPLSHVRDLVVAAQQAASPPRPVVSVLQGWSWAGGALPGAAQIRQMIWQSLIAGAIGLSIFDWNLEVWSKQPDFVAEIAAANALIADDLERFLVGGRRSQIVESGDVCARVWTADDGQWRILVTRLNDSHTNADVMTTIRLPATLRAGECLISTSPGNFYPLPVTSDGRFTVELPPLASIVVASNRPVEGSTQIWRPGAPVPAGRTAWRCDLAGRPWTRLLPDRDDGAAPVPVAVPVLTTSETDDPFVAARMSITMESATADDDPLATAAAVNGAFQGGRFRVALVVDPGRATSVHLAPLSWTLPGGTTPRAMAKAVRIRRSFAGQAGRGRQVRFLIDIPITNDRELPANRDHLLSVRLRFQFGDAEHQTTRVLRWRLRSCADINWQWTGNYTGELRAAPSFPLSCYTPDWSKQQWQFDGPSLQVMKATHDSRRIRLTTERAGERLPLTFYLGMTHGRPLAEQTMTHVTVRDGQVIAPHIPKVGVARPWQGLWPTSLEEAWKAVRPDDMLQDFVHFGAADFTNEKHRAWFFYDSRYLYWFMQSFRYGHRRAETTGHDQSFLGDDSMMLFVSDTAGSVYRVMVNPAGATHDMKMKPKPDKGWNPQVSVLTDATETEHWRIAVRVPWQDLLGPDFEAVPGTTVPVNLVTGRSIAPRIMSSWHPWLPPYDPTSTLGTMILGEAAK